MIIVSHPTGNTFVRGLLSALQERQLLGRFYTTLALHEQDRLLSVLPPKIRRQAARRGYQIPLKSMVRFPLREIVRHGAKKFHLDGLTQHELGWASVDAVYSDLDRRVAKALPQETKAHALDSVYCYEDSALQTFKAAQQLGLRRFYDLPIAYWQTGLTLLSEEAERLPDWEPTLVSTRDSAQKFERKTEELALAETVIVPSQFVYDSLPVEIRATKDCQVVPFGSPALLPRREPASQTSRPLRVIFAGSMSQRKGLADVFAAMNLLERKDVELLVLGSLLQPLAFYQKHCANFRYEAPRPHAEVLKLMQECDVFVLPSIVEGRALVQQEALACGLPLIVTPNAGGQDLIEPGKTGFLVPIRSPEAIAEKINWFADHREQLEGMRAATQAKAAQYTWHQYGDTIAQLIINGAKQAKA